METGLSSSNPGINIQQCILTLQVAGVTSLPIISSEKKKKSKSKRKRKQLFCNDNNLR